MTRVLFVDDEPAVLDGIRRLLWTAKTGWVTSYAVGAAAALELLERERYDVIVSDVLMPKMDGVELLSQVREHHPHMLRVILSGHSDHELIYRAVGVAHQYLSKPCDPAELQATIRRSMSMVRYLSDERLQSAVAGLGTLPSMPELYSALMKELQDPNCSPRRIGAIVSQDVAMTAQILRLVNSSFFGLRQHVSSPEVAVLYLGTATIAALALGHGLFGRVDASAMKWARLDETWRHASSAGALAGRLARSVTDDRAVIEESVSGGLLHPIGKLVLACNVPQVYRKLLEEAERDGVPVVDLERGRLGVTHSEIGAYLAGIWGLPGTISEAIAFHHAPRDSESRELGPLAIVHCACLLTGGCQEGVKCAEARPDRDYLREVDPEGRLGALVDEELEAAPAAEASE